MNHTRSLLLFDRSPAEWQAVPATPLRSKDELRSVLRGLLSGEPRIFDAVSPEGTTLQLGLGGPYACAQFLKTIPGEVGAPPTFMARTATCSAPGEVEFLIAATPSPIPPEYCLSPEEALRTTEFFFESGNLDPATKWDRVC